MDVSWTEVGEDWHDVLVVLSDSGIFVFSWTGDEALNTPPHCLFSTFRTITAGIVLDWLELQWMFGTDVQWLDKTFWFYAASPIRNFPARWYYLCCCRSAMRSLPHVQTSTESYVQNWLSTTKRLVNGVNRAQTELFLQITLGLLFKKRHRSFSASRICTTHSPTKYCN